MFFGITARMISSSTLISQVPDAKDRGAFMSINSSVQQISGGISSFIAGLIVYQSASGQLQRYPLLGIVVNIATLAALAMIYWLHQHVNIKKSEKNMTFK
jgi:predicted MFS family arabinose efflux permease